MEYESVDNLLHEERVECNEERIHISLEVRNLINRLSNQRYCHVIRKLILEDMEPQKVADEMNISVDNLYNIKHRALKQLSQIVGKEKRFQ